MTDPLYKRFKQQQARAKRSGIAWYMAFWEWVQIWEESGHLHDRGPHKGEWVMARHGDRGPYHPMNVKIVRCEKNNSDAANGRWAARRARKSAEATKLTRRPSDEQAVGLLQDLGASNAAR